METTEHITESYVRHVLGWFTNSNIKARGGKEIDIIAVDKKGNKYHIECGVTHKKQFALMAKPSKNALYYVIKKTKKVRKWRHRNSVDFFVRAKFNDKKIKERLKDFGFKKNYKKIIVVWQVADKKVHKYAKSKGVEIWELKDKIKELTKTLGETYYPDDILRTLQLVNKVNKESKNEIIFSIKEMVKDKKVIREIKRELKDRL